MPAAYPAGRARAGCRWRASRACRSVTTPPGTSTRDLLDRALASAGRRSVDRGRDVAAGGDRAARAERRRHVVSPGAPGRGRSPRRARSSPGWCRRSTRTIGLVHRAGSAHARGPGLRGAGPADNAGGERVARGNHARRSRGLPCQEIKQRGAPMFSRHKSEMPTADDALPGRADPPVRRAASGTSCSARRSSRRSPRGSSQAIFGMGCFWGAERKFWEARGVYTTAVGYAGGFTPNPTYEEVCSGRTGHTEVVLVVFDPRKTSYERCSRVLGEPRPDAGHAPGQRRRHAVPLRRSTCFGDEQATAAEASRAMFQERLDGAGYGDDHDRDPRRAPTFYYAEDYHQQYLAKNPSGYCGLGGTGVSCPIGVARASRDDMRYRRVRELRWPTRTSVRSSTRTSTSTAQAVECAARVDAAHARPKPTSTRCAASTSPCELQRGRRRVPAAVAAAEPPVRGDA